MNYETQQIIKRLREVRLTKGMSQTELSKLSGVSQAQISKIEANAINLRLSSLIVIANALDLELVWVPRKALPAVNSIIRQIAPATSLPEAQDAQRPAYTLDEDDDV